MEILIIIALVFVNGIFSMSEMSLVSSRKFKLENAKRKGSKGAITALELTENPTKFLSTIQIGITLIGILLGVYSGENLTNDVTDFLIRFEPIKAYADNIATGIIVVFITYLTIVLGELLPKRLGMTFPEPIAIMLAKPMKILSLITSPFVWLLTSSNGILLKLLGINKISQNKTSEEEIKSIMKESAQEGEIQDIEHNIMERVFELGDRKVNTLLTHRNDVIFFTINDTWEEIKHKINQEKHSVYPVSESHNIDDSIGIVSLKDLFTPTSDKDFNIEDYIKAPLYFNEGIFAYKVLELFKKEKIDFGIVVDEYGSTLGIVTMDDVVDALLEDVTENDQEKHQITQRGNNSWLVDGRFYVLDFFKYFDMDTQHGKFSGYTTVAGLILNKMKRLPEIGEKIDFKGYELEIIDKDGQRIDKILVTKKN
ncbi:MAG: HlyC/CorC family transporter [Saprospiraceae bacterium]|nr:HlyC/CorC family transporter [Saprospiraceae bacterium]